jgi:hypothetical protein
MERTADRPSSAVAHLVLVRPMRASLVTALFLATIVAGDAANFIRADVYFRGWFSERYAAISPEQLRDEARHGSFGTVTAHIASASELQQLLAALDLPRLHPERGDPRSDTCLVLDLFDSAGARTTYRSNGAYLWSADCTRGRKIDERFRKFFERFTRRPN